jgi:hypothetical protein
VLLPAGVSAARTIDVARRNVIHTRAPTEFGRTTSRLRSGATESSAVSRSSKPWGQMATSDAGDPARSSPSANRGVTKSGSGPGRGGVLVQSERRTPGRTTGFPLAGAKRRLAVD